MFTFYAASSKDKGLIVHISATKLRLLELADEIGFTKRTRNGMRNFNIGSLDDFIFDGERSDDMQSLDSVKKRKIFVNIFFFFFQCFRPLF